MKPDSDLVHCICCGGTDTHLIDITEFDGKGSWDALLSVYLIFVCERCEEQFVVMLEQNKGKTEVSTFVTIPPPNVRQIMANAARRMLSERAAGRVPS